ncbi:MAG: PQQ-binding-like beta-propeller repeat protein [Phycisphaeraceae bacterium]
MRHLRLAVLSLALGLMTGCASSTAPWNWFAGESEQRVLIEAPAASELGYTLSWLEDLGLPADEEIAGVYPLGDLIIVIEQQSNTIWALSARDGQRQWATVVGNPDLPLHGALRHDGLVHISSTTRLYSLREHTGELIDTTPLESAVTTGPVHHENYAIFGAINGRIFAHGFESNFPAWLYKLPDQIITPPVLTRGRVFFADASGNYVLLDANNGDRLWRGHTFGPVTAKPVADENTIYVASEDRSLYALSLGNLGEDRWRYHTDVPLTRSPVVFQDVVFLSIPGHGTIALDIETGEPLWEMSEQDNQPILQRGDELLLSTGQSLELVEARTGALVAQAPTLTLERVIPGPDDSLILVSPDGRLMRLDRTP